MQTADLLGKFPRVSLMHGRTPIQRLDRLEEVLGTRRQEVRIWAKRDDFMELGGGGNKLRKLEFLLGQAISEGCSTVVATGGIQSNFARLAAAACAKTGLKCELVLAQMVPRQSDIYQQNGNVLLDQLFGAHVHLLSQGENPAAFVKRRSDEIAGDRGKAFIAVLGGSTPIGCLGYVDCAFELTMQAKELDIVFDHIVIPNGSGGMHAGLAAGMVLAEDTPTKIKAHTVLSPREACITATVEKVNAIFDLLSVDKRIEQTDVEIGGDELGGGYGIPTSAMVDAIRMIGKSEGLLLDPVYGGKALAGLLADIKSGVISPRSNVLFVMTGGIPGLYAYSDVFM